MVIFKKLALLTLVLSTLAVASSAAAQPPYKTYLPSIRTTTRSTLFAFEPNPGWLHAPPVKAQADLLQAHWVRLNGVTWHTVEPNEGGAYNWSSLAILDRDIAAARSIGLTPTVIIRGAPLWAAVYPSNCAAVRDDKFGAYAAFLEAVAARYKGQVDYWEMGNEPDVDARLVGSDAPFGCQGDIDDPYYGGERYGRMLQVASAALKRGNPHAKIIFGGLILDSPETTTPGRGRPELFLEGALRAGAANSFDILAFHGYASYLDQRYLDYSLLLNGPWAPFGGWLPGRVKYLRDTMARYGIDKPLWLNETSIVCSVQWGSCSPPSADFFAAQADHLPRVFARAAALNVQMVSWYTLEGPGWRNGGLLNGQQQPRAVALAFRQMYDMVAGYSRVESVNYGPGLEGYRFVKRQTVVDVLWSRNSTSQSAVLPLAKYRAAKSLTGGTAPGQFSSGNALITVGFSPVYIERLP